MHTHLAARGGLAELPSLKEQLFAKCFPVVNGRKRYRKRKTWGVVVGEAGRAGRELQHKALPKPWTNAAALEPAHGLKAIPCFAFTKANLSCLQS